MPALAASRDLTRWRITFDDPPPAEADLVTADDRSSASAARRAA